MTPFGASPLAGGSAQKFLEGLFDVNAAGPFEENGVAGLGERARKTPRLRRIFEKNAASARRPARLAASNM